ncbi:MAG: hypothetical protein O7E52_01665 [Candidatus Poribacteria bacterium]|nr:hypothetical protein [Candidatus Poribacteria bacterium]
MPDEMRVAADVEVLETQIRQNREEIDRLKQEIEQLRTDLGLGEPNELQTQLKKGEVFEFGTLANGVIKGKINWMDDYLISITADEEESQSEVLIFKQALAYIRKPEEKSVSRRGMYI